MLHYCFIIPNLYSRKIEHFTACGVRGAKFGIAHFSHCSSCVDLPCHNGGARLLAWCHFVVAGNEMDLHDWKYHVDDGQWCQSFYISYPKQVCVIAQLFKDVDCDDRSTNSAISTLR